MSPNERKGVWGSWQLFEKSTGKIHPHAEELNPGLFIALEQKELHREQKVAQMEVKQRLGGAEGQREK